jgi:putative Ca2+/H+ antiporter (TMEM165/GDT1 family)
MLVADGLAVFAGDRLTAIVPMRMVRWIAAALFLAFGIVASDRRERPRRVAISEP